MLNRSASLAMSTSAFKALSGKLDIKRHSPSILYLLILDRCLLPYFDGKGQWSGMLQTFLHW